MTKGISAWLIGVTVLHGNLLVIDAQQESIALSIWVTILPKLKQDESCRVSAGSCAIMLVAKKSSAAKLVCRIIILIPMYIMLAILPESYCAKMPAHQDRSYPPALNH